MWSIFFYVSVLAISLPHAHRPSLWARSSAGFGGYNWREPINSKQKISKVKEKRETHQTNKLNNKHTSCEQATVPVVFSPSTGRVLIQLIRSSAALRALRCRAPPRCARSAGLFIFTFLVTTHTFISFLFVQSTTYYEGNLIAGLL